MTATATQNGEQALVSQPDTSVLWMARRSELRLVKVPIYNTYGPSGQKAGETQGQTIAFRDGVFRCPLEGEVTLENGTKADAAEVNAWMETHRNRGDLEEGFWRVDPTAPAVSPDEIKALVKLGQRADLEGLERFIAEEEAGWNRADLLDAARDTLATVKTVLAEIAEEEERQAAEAAAGQPDVPPQG